MNRAHGGTLTLWKAELDPYISVLPTHSSRISAIVLDIPFHQKTVHINIYLPTAGLDSDFIESLATLQNTIDEATDMHPTAIVYVKGDANASCPPRPNNRRDALFKLFCEDNNFLPLQLEHKTYHHFTGGGKSDSSIDVALSSTASADGVPSPAPEILLEILCCKEDTRVANSHHDVIISKIPLNFIDSPPSSDTTDSVPTIENNRHKVSWDEENLQNYCELIHPVLSNLQDTWLDSPSPSSLSILLQQTNTILSSAAKATQKTISLSKKNQAKKPAIPADISEAFINHKLTHDNLKEATSNPSSSPADIESARFKFSKTRAALQNIKRRGEVCQEIDKAEHLHTILTSNPSSLFRRIKSNKRDTISVNKLTVGNETFTGDDVGKGFFKSISNLKTRDHVQLQKCKTFKDFISDHSHILEICQQGQEIPLLDFSQAQELLMSIKPSVIDLFNVSALHYLHGGDPAIRHFQLLINAVLSDVQNYVLSEINTVHAIVLHKGHGKAKTFDRSYRTISSCPFIAKCADKYIGLLEEDNWRAAQAETQFQGKGLSHEHAALLLTESINFSTSVSKLPIFSLYLDARSAYDRALRELLTRRMFLDGTGGHSLLYLDARIDNRVTYIEWDKTLMGPINDEQGVEQGGPNSTEEYKIYNNEQLTTA